MGDRNFDVIFVSLRQSQYIDILNQLPSLSFILKANITLFTVPHTFPSLKMRNFYYVEYLSFSCFLMFAKICLHKTCSLTLPSAYFTFLLLVPHHFFSKHPQQEFNLLEKSLSHIYKSTFLILVSYLHIGTTMTFNNPFFIYL